MSAITDKLQLLTASRARDARACKRLHRYRYELGYRPVFDADELRFGQLFHDGQEAWWKAAMHRAPVELWLDMALGAIETAKDADPFDQAKARVLLRGYHLMWKDEPLEVLGVEERFETALVNPESGAPSRTWRLAGRLDVRARDLRDGLVKVVEHKTASGDITPGSDYWKRLRIDGQVSVYFDGAEALGEPPAACIYDVIGKPQLRPHKATPPEQRKYTKDGRLYANQHERDETPEEYEARLTEAVAENPTKFYGRAEVVRLPEELEEARFDLWQLAKEIREGHVAQRWPRNPDSCVRYGRTCEFFAVCTREASLEDQTRYRKVEEVHPELAEEAAGVGAG